MMDSLFIKLNLIDFKWLLPSLLFLALGCQSNPDSNLLYPNQKQLQIRLICSRAYSGPEARHQTWEKSPVSWLFVTEDLVTYYFDNDQTRVISKKPSWNLPPGKYRCDS
jgi:hypothetical protein